MYKSISSFLNFSKEQSKRVSKNFISQITLNSSLTIFQLLFPPLMIMIYGLENFGVWVFLNAIPSVLALLNFDLNAAAKTEMSIFFNKKDKKKINEIFNNATLITVLFIFVISIIGFLFITSYDFDLKILRDINIDELNIILICIFSVFYLNIFNSVFKTGITYWGRLDIGTYLEIFFDFSSKLLIIILGIIFNKLLFAFIALLIVTILKIIIFYFFFLKFNKYLTLFSFNLISRKHLLRLFKLSTSYYLESGSNIIKHSFQIIILGTFFDAKIVGLVSTSKTLFYFLPIRAWGIFAKVMFYEFTKLYAEKKFIKLKETYIKFLKFGFVFLVTCVFTFLSLGEYIYNFWLNYSYKLDYFLLILIIIDLIFFVSAGSISFVNKSINKFFEISTFQIILNLVIIIIAYLFFIYQQSFYYLFLLNMIGSILIFIYSIYFSVKLKLFKNYKR